MASLLAKLFSRSDREEESTTGKASLSDTQEALNAAAGKSGFRCVPVSWEDAQRGTVDGALSCWGGNISDVRLWAKDGTLLYTLRTENWNERLGYVASKDVAVVVGNHVPGGSPPTPITLQRYLKNFKEYAAYAGNTSEQLWDEEADKLLTIRFQAVFLPIADEETSEFCTEVYNYNTHDDDDPRNQILLCTAQGTNAQQDGAGAKKIFIHSVDPRSTVHRYWLEAERSKHKVGGAQKETDEEAAAAIARGKATAIHIGTKAMGTRFNVQMLIQLPLKQKERPAHRNMYFADDCYACCASSCAPKMMECSAALMCDDDNDEGEVEAEAKCDASESASDGSDTDECPTAAEEEKGKEDCLLPSEMACDEEEEAPIEECKKMCSRRKESSPPKKKAAIGTSNAARVSRGSEYDSTWAGLNNKAPCRDPSQHGTITVTLYYTVAGGVPSVADVEACVADLDALYKACPTDKHLVDCGEVTAELTVKDMNDIAKKIKEQPYVPPNFAPVKGEFPTDDD